jgi:hypothetical protein
MTIMPAAVICQFTFAQNQISVTLVPFLPRFEIDAAFHTDASLQRSKRTFVKCALVES